MKKVVSIVEENEIGHMSETGELETSIISFTD